MNTTTSQLQIRIQHSVGFTSWLSLFKISLFELGRKSSSSPIYLLISQSFDESRKLLPVTGNFVLWQELSSCDSKFLPVTGHFFLWQEMSSSERKDFPVTGNFYPWQKMLSSEGKDHPSTGSFFLWQGISSCDRKFLSLAGNFFLSQKISSCHRKFLPKAGYFFLWQESFLPKISGAGYFWCEIATKVRDFWLHLKIAAKVHDFLSKLRLRVQGFLPRFLAPWPLKSHPAPQFLVDWPNNQ